MDMGMSVAKEEVGKTEFFFFFLPSICIHICLLHSSLSLFFR